MSARKCVARRALRCRLLAQKRALARFRMRAGSSVRKRGGDSLSRVSARFAP